MNTLIYGPNGQPVSPAQEALIVDPSFQAARTSWWPYDYKSAPVFGHYRLSVEVAASASIGNPLEFRWTSSTALMALLKMDVSSAVGTAGASTSFQEAQLQHGRGWSAAPTGASATPTPVKSRVTMPASQASFFVYPTSDGTVVFDGVAFAYKRDQVVANVAGSTSGIITMLYRCDIQSGEQPEVFYQNEGFKLQYGSANLTGGTQALRITLVWMEIALPVILET